MTTPDPIDALAAHIFGTTPKAARAKGTCVQCKEPALAKCYSEAGRREYALSGLCEACFDAMFPEDDDDGPVVITFG